MKGFNNEYDKSVEGLSKSLMDIFMQYHWKGNVRELKHIIENMVSISEEKLLTVNSLPIYMKDSIELETREHKGKDKDKDKPFIQFQSLQNTIEDAERSAIVKALSYTDGHLTRAAELLAIPRQTLKYKMNRLDIKKGDFKNNGY